MAHETIALWPDGSENDRPRQLVLYPSARAESRGAVMVLPGGGYGKLTDYEGPDVAERLAEAGFDAAVLRYRIAPNGQHPDMIHDAQRGLRLMRQHPAIRSPRIAVLGFSAGGHLASTLAVHHGRFATDRDDLAPSVSVRPDAAVLCYPVIDLAGPDTHLGSRENLLGQDPAPELMRLLSTDAHVTADTPPTFLWHTAEDEPVPMNNSLRFAAACRAARVPVELHVYETGVHGLGLAEDHDAKMWFYHCLAFLDRHLNPKGKG